MFVALNTAWAVTESGGTLFGWRLQGNLKEANHLAASVQEIPTSQERFDAMATNDDWEILLMGVFLHGTWICLMLEVPLF